MLPNCHNPTQMSGAFQKKCINRINLQVLSKTVM
jgi:hypothetical protein